MLSPGYTIQLNCVNIFCDVIYIMTYHHTRHRTPGQSVNAEAEKDHFVGATNPVDRGNNVANEILVEKHRGGYGDVEFRLNVSDAILKAAARGVIQGHRTELMQFLKDLAVCTGGDLLFQYLDNKHYLNMASNSPLNKQEWKVIFMLAYNVALSSAIEMRAPGVKDVVVNLTPALVSELVTDPRVHKLMRQMKMR